MSEESRSDSENDGNSENLSSDEHENDDNERISEYEKQRIERIKENRARLEALRLPTLASSLLGSVEKKVKRKGKEKKEEDDEEYKPSEDEKRVSSSSEEGEENSEDEEFQQSRASARKGKGKHPLSKIDKKKNPVRSLDFIDDDEALQQALALSLEESSAVSGAVLHETPQDRRTFVADAELKERKGRKPVQETDKRKKRRIPNTSRVQITEDQVIIHFFQFDEAGKGGITVKDLQRVAEDHDFPWSDKEIADMIHLFDNDGDGRLDLDDFRRILHQCNIIKG